MDRVKLCLIPTTFHSLYVQWGHSRKQRLHGMWDMSPTLWVTVSRMSAGSESACFVSQDIQSSAHSKDLKDWTSTVLHFNCKWHRLLLYIPAPWLLCCSLAMSFPGWFFSLTYLSSVQAFFIFLFSISPLEAWTSCLVRKIVFILIVSLKVPAKSLLHCLSKPKCWLESEQSPWDS